MLLALMQETRNFFVHTTHPGRYAIEDEVLDPLPDGLAQGQYIAITGSALNDGLYKLGAGGLLTDEDGESVELSDEAFLGVVYGLSVPRAFVTLANEIAEFATKTPVTAVVSESFGNYSHTNATGLNGAVLGWQEVFAARLTPFRRMFAEVALC